MPVARRDQCIHVHYACRQSFDHAQNIWFLASENVAQYCGEGVRVWEVELQMWK